MLEKAKKLLYKMKHKPKKTVLIFSDETPFSLVATETGFLLAPKPNDIPDDVHHMGNKRSVANLQIFAVVASDGRKCSLIFSEEKMRLNSTTHVEILWGTVFLWANYGTG
ncbi:Uncharacterized protein FKW44_004335 [Caligus rogercresseyi]|uniref:Uncharacterized protein n=1 Tax=Caligus rogercresseyi TaxID=217165 RepID=A0A7T8HLP7_CALRO|nr:Uncharacterized protein FKW44_004335 [Caligus rogercresseyi]